MASAWDVSGRPCVVTGASAGIGLEAARGLARAGGHVVLAVRSAERGQAAAHDIRSTVPGASLEVGVVDLARPAGVRSFAADLRRRHPEVAVLVNNAGVWSSTRQVTPDGLELTWATNVLGYHVMAEALLPALVAARGRVVNVASELAGRLDLTDPQFERRAYSGVAAYAQSKQADRMLAWELARRVEALGVTVHAMHPGGVSTGIFRKGGGLQGLAAAILARLFGRSAALGADTIVWLATDPALTNSTGKYWIDRREAVCPHRDVLLADRLVELCRRMAPA
jgi:NAD(P)-dependent dehydrogenase (short-subunit alcohol dehydrogenase family)